MKSPIFSRAALGLCLALLGGCAADSGYQVAPENKLTPQGATNFTSQRAGFSIYFPTQATEKVASGQSQWGDYQTYTYQSATAPVTYVVLAMTIPDNVDKTNATQFLDGVQKGFLASAQATIDKTRDVTLNDLPGRELHISMRDGAAVGRMYVYLAPKISYQVMAIGLKSEFESQAAQAETEKVLGSFRVTGK